MERPLWFIHRYQILSHHRHLQTNQNKQIHASQISAAISFFSCLKPVPKMALLHRMSYWTKLVPTVKFTFYRARLCSTSGYLQRLTPVVDKTFKFPQTEPDLRLLLNPENRPKILENLTKRLEMKLVEAERELDELRHLAEVIN